MQFRTWDPLMFGDLKRVTVNGTMKVAEMLDTSHMPLGRSVPEQDGVWLSFLGEDNVVRHTADMHM
jgi:hypothetical protein